MTFFNQAANERGASSWDLVLKILSIMLVALFAFSSGVWFGKKLSDSDYQRMALEGEFDREVRKTASVDDDKEHDHDEKNALTDEEVALATEKALAGKKTEAADGHGDAGHGAAAHGEATHAAATAGDKGHGDSHATTAASGHGDKAHGKAEKLPEKAAVHAAPAAAAHGSAAHGHEAAAPAAKPDLSAAHQAAVRVANNASPVAKAQPPAESRIPSSLPKTVGTSNDVEFTVQVASYPTVAAAKEHVDGLVKKGFPAFPVEAKIGGKVWYRVSVGSFKSFNDASKFRAQLLKQADLPSAIVQKISRN